jgi:hypothetical protein
LLGWIGRDGEQAERPKRGRSELFAGRYTPALRDAIAAVIAEAAGSGDKRT